MNIFISPNDVLMFRDGRPFSGGDDHFAHCIFPPSPTTIYGALRAHILSIHFPDFKKYSENIDIPKDIVDEIGTPQTYGSLSIDGFFVARLEGNTSIPYFSIPLDVVNKKGEKEDNINLSIMAPNESLSKLVKSDMNILNYSWITSKDFFEPISGFLSRTEMTKYLKGEVPTITESKDIFTIEERTGIGKNILSRSVERGRLYTVGYIRVNTDFGFLIKVANSKLLPEKGMLRIGGDGRSAAYFKCNYEDLDIGQIKNIVDRTKRFKIVLITPAVFRKGWLFDWVDSNTMLAKMDNFEIKLVGAIVGRPTFIGGFDLVKRAPKEMKKAVPSGSVYYFEILKGDLDKIFDFFWMKTVSEERGQEGLGISIIGGY